MPAPEGRDKTGIFPFAEYRYMAEKLPTAIYPEYSEEQIEIIFQQRRTNEHSTKRQSKQS